MTKPSAPKPKPEKPPPPSMWRVTLTARRHRSVVRGALAGEEDHQKDEAMKTMTRTCR